MSATRKRKAPAPKRKKSSDPPPPSVPHAPDHLIPQWMNAERTKILTAPQIVEPKKLQETVHADATYTDEALGRLEGRNKQCVYYWMQRDMRTADNWALLFAQHLAQEQNIPLKVVYVLPPPLSSHDDSEDGEDDDDAGELPPKVCEIPMTKRHGTFLVGGLKIVEEELHEKNVTFHILKPDCHSKVGQCIHDFCIQNEDGDHHHDSDDNDEEIGPSASAIVCDMSPLRQYREWMECQAAPLLIDSGVPLYQVDAHNVVPVWHASPKREVGARTLRPKINKLLPDFLTHYPDFEGNAHMEQPIDTSVTTITWEDCEQHLNLDSSIGTVEWAKPGRSAAMKRFDEFTSSKTEGLKNFDTSRNDPNFKNVCSNLSPWVNYGHVSFQRLALDVRALKKYPNGTASYIEEGIVRRELSDNFVYYSQENYDELSTAAVWAQESLNLHTTDEREYIYSLKEFEQASTHDDLWNAAQMQLNIEGKMHGFLRMYWAKKILEWTASPKQALSIGLYLNDRYALDGNDPNGFTGVGWSVMGIHDMGWKERPIFGKIRFMNYAGCKRKFKVDQFVARYIGMQGNPESSSNSSSISDNSSKQTHQGNKASASDAKRVAKLMKKVQSPSSPKSSTPEKTKVSIVKKVRKMKKVKKILTKSRESPKKKQRKV